MLCVALVCFTTVINNEQAIASFVLRSRFVTTHFYFGGVVSGSGDTKVQNLFHLKQR
jgi:hypothetical protein